MIRSLPYFTRMLAVILILMNVAGLFGSVNIALGNSVAQTIFARQWHRLVTSAFAGNAMTSGGFSYTIQKFKSIEAHIGTSRLLIVFLMALVTMNALHLLLCASLYLWTDRVDYIWKLSLGVWPVYLAVSSMLTHSKLAFGQNGSCTSLAGVNPILDATLFTGRISTTSWFGILFGYVFGASRCWEQISAVVERWERRNQYNGNLDELSASGFVSIFDSREYVSRGGAV